VPLEPGQIVSGRKPALQILGQLSFGGLSAVYLVGEGQNSSSENKVFILKEAVMPVSTEETLRVKAQEMFERESRLLSSLRHSRIARVYDSFVADGRHYILLEHIEGADLRRFVREHGPQPAAVALRWLVEAAEILRYLHNHEPAIVHRDVTPDNLVLARDGHLSLIDFGAANTMLGTATGTLVGKQSYIAPEQFRGKAQCASDIYSLAGTIYFALTATDPEPLSLLSPASIRSDIAEDFDRLIRHCTAQDVEQRIATADELLARARAIVL
jgi:serine/threonine-protein kinase